MDRLAARTKSLAGVRFAAFDLCPLSGCGTRGRVRGRFSARSLEFDLLPLTVVPSGGCGNEGRLNLAVAGVDLPLLTVVPSTGVGAGIGSGVGCIWRSLVFDLLPLTVVISAGLGVGLGIGLACASFTVFNNCEHYAIIRNMNNR